MDQGMVERLLMLMLNHIGWERRIGMGELFAKVFSKPFEHRINDTRDLRRLISAARRQGAPICSTTNDKSPGYWLDLDGHDLKDYCLRLERRALKALAQAAVLRRVTLPELLGQLALEWENAESPG
jgi:hypothetical protein